MAGWTKLFSSIVTSSIWCEDDKTFKAWIALLALSDREGVVEGSVPGLANLCRLSTSEMRTALKKLSEPDPDSRSPEHEGRRIQAIEGGWLLLNYAKYREKAVAGEGSRAPYYRAYRARKRAELFREQDGPGSEG
jgi:hypothetical protein